MADRHPPDDNGGASLEELARYVSDLRRALEQAASREDTQRQAFDHLYQEMKQYKDDFIFQAEKPLLLDLLLFYDSLNWFRESLLKKDMSADVVSDSFQYLLDEFLELLYRRDVLPMEGAEAFDRTTQKAVKVVPTDDPRMDWRVDQVLKRGFTRAGRTLRAEEVVVHRYHDPESNE